MKSWQYGTTVALGAVCAGLSLMIVLTSRSNMRMQEEIQSRQQTLNSGVLGQQAQQITGNILQDMAAVGAKNEKMRTLLSKYGYNIQAAKPEPAVNETKEATREEK